ncbi:hypothetical protein HHI36_024334, partial [Cryptolaemus montrouzieri]
ANNHRFNNQRFNRQGYASHQGGNPNMYHQMPFQPYMMQQTGGPDPIHSIINHKFFQNSRIPSASNPCAYQSLSQGQATPYNQYPRAAQYTYQYSQPPTAAVQQ